MTSKKILITGSGSGIGKAAAFELARRGHQVVASCETYEQVEHIAQEAKAAGLGIEAIKLDVTLEGDRSFIAQHDLDVVISNAGIGQSGSLSEIPLDNVRHLFEVNLFSALAVAQVALKRMMARKRGSIIFVSSVAGRIPIAFLAPYGMTKFALSGGVAALRKEVQRIAPDINISLIEPGAYDTGFNQKMLESKYVWMEKESYFKEIIPDLQKVDARFIGFQNKSLNTIVKQIVRAAEADKPKLRYVAPWWQNLGVRIMRMFGV